MGHTEQDIKREGTIDNARSRKIAATIKETNKPLQEGSNYTFVIDSLDLWEKFKRQDSINWFKLTFLENNNYLVKYYIRAGYSEDDVKLTLQDFEDEE